MKKATRRIASDLHNEEEIEMKNNLHLSYIKFELTTKQV